MYYKGMNKCRCVHRLRTYCTLYMDDCYVWCVYMVKSSEAYKNVRTLLSQTFVGIFIFDGGCAILRLPHCSLLLLYGCVCVCMLGNVGMNNFFCVMKKLCFV